MFGLYRTITAENETDSNPTRENSVGFCNIFDTINIDTSPEAKKKQKPGCKPAAQEDSAETTGWLTCSLVFEG